MAIEPVVFDKGQAFSNKRGLQFDTFPFYGDWAIGFPDEAFYLPEGVKSGVLI